MLRKFQYLPCLEAHQYCTTQITPWYRAAAIALSTICDALVEALAAYRQYAHLMSCGMPHDTALRLATGTDGVAGQASRPGSGHECSKTMKTTSDVHSDVCLCRPAIPVFSALQHPVRPA